MPQDMKTWRRNAKRKLFEALGNKCATCGTDEGLEIGHKTPLTVAEHNARVRMGINARMVLYRKEHAAGRIKLLCHPCNLAERQFADDEPECPF